MMISRRPPLAAVGTRAPHRSGYPRGVVCISVRRHARLAMIVVSSMDLLDDPPSDPTPPSSNPSNNPPSPSESRMRRFSKILAFTAACSAALILTVRHGGDGLRVGADNQLRAAVRGASGKYDLSQLPIFSKTLFYVRENYFDKNRLDP